MSDAPQGHGWWVASDGKWYPPELHPDAHGAAPPPAAIADEGPVLATDEDREIATGKLREGLVSGQLTFEEHEERISAALRARSLQELDQTTRGLQQPVLPAHKPRRTGLLVAASVMLLAGVVAIAVAATGTKPIPRAVTPTTGVAGFRLPPLSPSLSPAEFGLASSPKSNFLGNAAVFSANGVGSQTSPYFRLNGAVMMGSVGQNGHGALYFLVPKGGTLDPTQPAASPTLPGQEGWAPGTSPPPGTYRLEVMAAATTHWNMTLDQFWIPPAGVTVARSSTVTSFGHPVVVASGSSNWESPPFTWPADPVGTNQFDGYDMVVAAMLGGSGISALLVETGGPTISLPMSGLPQISVRPGQYRLVVDATGPWAIAFEFGDTLSW